MRLAGLAAGLALATCAPQHAPLPSSPIPAGPAVRVISEPVPEFASDNATTVTIWVFADGGGNGFRYAGGVALTSPDTSRLHGLSDLEVLPNDRLILVGDQGDLVKGRIVLDKTGRLIGVADVTLAPLNGLDGTPLGGKEDSDAEGLARWPNGDLTVSFERRHRIWLYPANGGPPRPLPMPSAAFPENDGMEALALDPSSGPDAYVVGREDTREVWTCRLSGGCTPRPGVALAGPGSLVAARALPGGRWAWLLRDYSPLAGSTIWIVVTDRTGRTIDTHELKHPTTVDNFEGLAVLPRPNGTVRFYLISDDNFSSSQRTLLLAFDWTPPQ